jgi:very-short-patch-repair endonuclease
MGADPLFLALLKRAKIPAPTAELVFAPPRRFRFDYAWQQERVALEVEGGVWTGGRHTRGAGFLKDMEKYNMASALGWRIVRCTPKTLCTMDTVELIARCLTPLTTEQAA